MGALDEFLPNAKKPQAAATGDNPLAEFMPKAPAAAPAGDEQSIDTTAPVGSEGFMGGVADIGRGLSGGIPLAKRTVGQALEHFGATETGQAMQQAADRDLQANPAQKQSIVGQRAAAAEWDWNHPIDSAANMVRGGAYGGGANAPLSYGPMAAGAVAGGAIGAFGGPIGAGVGATVGALASLPIFYGSQAHETEKKVTEAQLKAGKTPEEAKAAATTAGRIAGGFEAGGELVGDLPIVGTFLKPFAKAGTKAVGEAVKSVLNVGWKQAAKTGAKIVAAENVTEMSQQAGESAVEGYYGAGPGATWKDTLSVVVPTTIMSLFPGGIAGAHQVRTAMKAKALFNNPNADPEARATAAINVFDRVKEVDPAAALAFQKYAGDMIASRQKIELGGDSLYIDHANGVPKPDAEDYAEKFTRAYGVEPGGLSDEEAAKVRQDAALRELEQQLSGQGQQPFNADQHFEGVVGPDATTPPDPLHKPDAGPLARTAALAVDTGLAPDPYQAPPAPDAHPVRAEVTMPPDLQMQNRDRSRPGSIAQMNAIANNPDYDRLGVGRSPNEAAPMVAVGGNAPIIPESDFGKADRVVMGDGSKIKVRYAVVEAPDVLASHNADGSVNGDYFAQVPPGTIRALNNGRTAGIQAAWQRGTTQGYLQGMIEDAQAHGVSPEAIAAKKNPMLVRVYDDAENARPNMGAISNPQVSLKPSATEQALNDARLLDFGALKVDDNGNVLTPENDTQVRQFLAAIPQAEHNELVTASGYTKQFADRLRSALFAKAYGNAEIVGMATEESDPDVKNVLHALTAAAPEFAKVDHGGPVDLRPNILEATNLIREARAKKMKPQDMLAQQDLLGRDPMTQMVADFMVRHMRSPQRMAAAFAEAARFLQNEKAASTSGDMFGRQAAGPADLAARVNSYLEKTYGADTQLKLETQAGRPEQGSQPGAGQRSGSDAAPAGNGSAAHAGSAAAQAALADPTVQKLPAQQQQTLAGLYATAEQQKPTFDRQLDAIAKAVGGKAAKPALKSPKRAAEKIIADYKGVAGKIKDILRGGIRVDTIEEAERAVAEVERVFGNGPKRNSFANEPYADGYRDALFNVKIGGHTAEVQVWIASMVDAKENGPGHKLYEQRQAIERKIETENRAATPEEKEQIAALNEQMRALYDPLWEEATKARKAPSDNGVPLRRAEAESKGSGAAPSKRAQYGGESQDNATGTPSTSKNSADLGKESGSFIGNSILPEGGQKDNQTGLKSTQADTEKQQKPTLKERAARVRQQRDTITATLDAGYTRDGIVIARRPDGNTIAFMENAHGTSKFRVQTFDKDMAPVGHREYGSAREAAAEFTDASFENDVAAVLHEDAFQLTSYAAPSQARALGKAIARAQRKAKAKPLNPAQAELFKAAEKLLTNAIAATTDPKLDTPKAKTARERAMAALLQLGRMNLLAASINLDLVRESQVNIIGQRVTSTQDLAALAQVYRDPRFETFRYIFVKDGKIIHETAVSSRLPASTAAFGGKNASESTPWFIALREQYKASGADGYYLLHNHPSGRATPSAADLSVTQWIADRMSGFQGHVVIDTNEFSVIHDNGQATVHNADFGGVSPRKLHVRVTGKTGHAALDLFAWSRQNSVMNPRAIATMGKNMQEPGQVPVIALSAEGHVVAVSQIPVDTVERANGAKAIGIARFQAMLTRFARASGAGGGVFLADWPAHVRSFGEALVQRGVVRDVVGSDGTSAVEVLNALGRSIGDYRALGRGGFVGRAVSASLQEEKAPYDTNDLFGNAGQVNQERRARVKREAPAFASLPSAQFDLFGLPANTGSKETANASQRKVRSDRAQKPSGEPTGDLFAPASNGQAGIGAGGPRPDGGGTDQGNAPGAPTQGGAAGGGAHGSGKPGNQGPAPVPGPGGSGNAGVRRPPAYRPPKRQGTDFRITRPEAIGTGSAREKYADNVAAIRLLKQLEAEGRKATPDEQATLIKYVGWGGLKNAFYTGRHEDIADGRDERPGSWRHDYIRSGAAPEWEAQRRELYDLLTREEYELARGSTPNAHYTAPQIIQGVWGALEHLGFKGGRILEPALGTGHFFGMLPESMRGKSTLSGVELDSLTARIAGQLYQTADVRAQGFEAAQFPDGYFDVAVSNVPFGDYRVSDPKYDRAKLYIHDYFFVKALDRVRPGGIVAFVTSDGTLDKLDPKARAMMADKAVFLGAVRLPNDAFKKNAGTEVTTDIVFLQKKGEGVEAKGAPAWLNVKTVKTPTGDVRINEYFADHPDMMLGTMGREGTMYGASDQALKSDGRDLPTALAKALLDLPANRFQAKKPSKAFDPVPAEPGIKQGALVVRNGKVLQNNGGMMVVQPDLDVAKVTALIALRDAARAHLAAQVGENESAYQTTQRALNAAYDAFVKAHGAINTRANLGTVMRDSDGPFLSALEKWDDEKQRATKADIFSKRTVSRAQPATSADSPASALAVTLNDRGRVDIDHMAALTGLTPDEVIGGLQGRIFHDPITREWEVAEGYLAGNVRQKLRDAEAAAKNDPRYEANAEALRAVQPADLTPGMIRIRLGQAWIPPALLVNFVRHVTGAHPQNDITVTYANATGEWRVSGNGIPTRTPEASSLWGTDDYPAGKLVEAALNSTKPKVYDHHSDGTRTINKARTLAVAEKVDAIRNEFEEWWRRDPDREAALVKKYNEERNTDRVREYDGSHLTLPGSNPNISVRPNVKDGAWRIVSGGNTLLAHVVGAGKTFTAIAGSMERQRLGLQTKAMHVVLKSTLDQYAREWQQLYPNANVLIARTEDFASPEARKNFVARVATGNWDGIVIAHSTFGKIPMSAAAQQAYLQEKINELEAAYLEGRANKDDKRILKRLEKKKKDYEAKLRRMLAAKNKDDLLNFEELGVDAIYVDEAHFYKNLEFTTNLQIPGIKGGESQRATDMFLKTQYLDRLNNGKGGVVFMTGTPISNTISEMYNMQRYLGLRALKAAGLENFDAWASMFGDPVTTYEMRADGGGYAPKTRFARFVNMGELTRMFRAFADVKTQAMLKLPVPEIRGGKPEIVVAPPTPEMKAYIATLVDRAELVRERRVLPTEDNMLKITSDGRLASLDLRLVNPKAPNRPDSKLNLAVRDIHALWKAGKSTRTAQMVFSDLSTPNPKRFNAYQYVRDSLVKKGVPPGEIAFIQTADTDAKRDQLFADVRSGKVRILIGSTEKMGTGVNVQKNLAALHHLDVPHRPADIEQRNGRGIRQGNSNSVVDVKHYVTEGSFDTFMWQAVERKAGFIEQAMNADTTVREIEDVDSRALTYAELKAFASGNPLILEKATVDGEVQRLYGAQQRHLDQASTLRRQAAERKQQAAALREEAANAAEDAKHIVSTRADAFRMTIGGKPYTDRVEAANAMHAALARAPAGDGTMLITPIGKIGGFDFSVERGSFWKGGDTRQRLRVEGRNTYSSDLGESVDGNLQRLENTVQAIADHSTFVTAQATEAERQAEVAASNVGKPFPQQAQLEKLLTRQREIDKELGIGQDDAESDDTNTDDAGTADEPRSPYETTPPRAVEQTPFPYNTPPAQAAAARVANPTPPPGAPQYVQQGNPHLQSFLRKAGVWAAKQSIRDRFAAARQDAGLKILQGTVDQFLPVLRRIGEYPYKLLRMASAYTGGVEALLFQGQVRLNRAGALDLAPNTRGLIEILKPLKGEHDRFLAWVAANRAERLDPQDREHLFTRDEYMAGKALNTKLNANDNMPDGTDGRQRAMIYANVHREFNALSKSVLDLAQQAGIIDGTTRPVWEHAFYVPFFREQEEGEPNHPSNVSGMVNQYAFKKLKGGTDILHDILSNTVANWSHLVQASLKNNAARETLQQAAQRQIAVPIREAQKGSVFVLDQGKKKHYLITDPLVYDALASMEAPHFRGPAMRALSWFKHILTMGVTLAPTFRIRNVMRDQVSALAVNPTSYNLVKNMIAGFKYSSTNNPVYGRMLAGGGLFRLGMTHGDDAAKHIRAIVDKAGTGGILDTAAHVKSMWTQAWDWWKETGERSESLTRANLYQQTYDRLVAAGKTPDEAHFEASYVARDSLDFGLHGSWMAVRMLTQVVPFMNARLQGLYKLKRGYEADPRRFGLVIGGVTLATILLTLMYRDDDDFKRREEWDRDNYWWFKIGDKAFRIPKPFEIGALATIVDRGLEAAMNGLGAEDRDRFANSLIANVGYQLNMNPIPQAVYPAIQLWANKNAFTGRPIEGEHEQNLSTSQRVNANTTATAQLLGKAGILSPEQIDFLVGAYLGWAGTHALLTADLALRPMMGLAPKPAMKIDDYFVIGDFVKDLPADQSRFVSQFYDHLKQTQQAMGDLRNFQRIGQLDAAAEILAKGGTDLRMAPVYAHTAREMAKISQEMRRVQASDLDPDTKRERLDRLNAQRARMAEQVETVRYRQEQ